MITLFGVASLSCAVECVMSSTLLLVDRLLYGMYASSFSKDSSSMQSSTNVVKTRCRRFGLYRQDKGLAQITCESPTHRDVRRINSTLRLLSPS